MKANRRQPRPDKSRRRSRRPIRLDQWTEADVQEMLLDPRIVGVGDFPPIIDEPTWLRTQVKQIIDLGPEVYAKRQLDTLREAFAGYAELLAEHISETEMPEGEHDTRDTDEIRQDYLTKKQQHADDPLVLELCDAGLALLDAEVALFEAPVGYRSPAKRAVQQAKHRMDQAALALYERNDSTTRALLRDWRPEQSH